MQFECKHSETILSFRTWGRVTVKENERCTNATNQQWWFYHTLICLHKMFAFVWLPLVRVHDAIHGANGTRMSNGIYMIIINFSKKVQNILFAVIYLFICLTQSSFGCYLNVFWRFLVLLLKMKKCVLSKWNEEKVKWVRLSCEITKWKIITLTFKLLAVCRWWSQSSHWSM